MFPRRTMLRHHLRSNLFPPVSDEFVDTAKHAIDLANRGEYGARIALPGGGYATVRECVTGLHLAAFLDRSDV